MRYNIFEKVKFQSVAYKYNEVYKDKQEACAI